MLQIRRGVYETNSSSSHSIIIKKKDHPLSRKAIDTKWYMHMNEDDPNDPDNGTIHFDRENLEFERDPFHFLVSWHDRLCYAIAAYQSKETVETLREICQRRIPGFRGFQFPSQRWILEDEGEDEEDNAETEDYYGFVDHQSECLLKKVLNHYHISLEEFVFNDKYVVVIDGDEYQYFETLTEQEFFNKDAIERIEPAEKWCTAEDDKEFQEWLRWEENEE